MKGKKRNTPVGSRGSKDSSLKLFSMSNLMGSYHMTQTKLVNISKSVTLTIGTRKKPTPTKPKYFLLLDTPQGKRVYLSSLYPDPQKQAENDPQGYSFEVDGVWYDLTLNREVGQAAITLREGKVPCISLALCCFESNITPPTPPKP